MSEKDQRISKPQVTPAEDWCDYPYGAYQTQDEPDPSLAPTLALLSLIGGLVVYSLPKIAR